MPIRHAALAIGFALALCGCATVQYGDKDTQARLRQLLPVAGKTSLYVCREAAAFLGAGNRTTVMLNGRAIGTLKPSNFAHAVVEPGAHEIYIRRSPGGDSGALRVTSQPGEVVVLWVGITGAGFGALTIDHFSNRSEAERCVQGGEYSVPADS